MNMPAGPLAALDARIAREILRLRARYELTLDEFRGLYISDEHVDQLVASTREAVPLESARLPRPSDQLRTRDDRWSHLAGTFSLTALEEDFLLIALAPELDLKYET